jgi:hypothetical protein
MASCAAEELKSIAKGIMRSGYWRGEKASGAGGVEKPVAEEPR